MSKLSIQTTNLHFEYGEKTKVFENHSLRLEIGSDDKNKLYGIIGPSGTGKSTFISILGGQLKPTGGDILVCETNIYAVTDPVRRGLICMQIQTSTALRGKLRYNLVFGLPEENDEVEDDDLDRDDLTKDDLTKKPASKESSIYNDAALIEVLQKVGLWNLFESKEGLDTLIGEGGINLSGGQRQRLNFAGLYLRAKYFQPKLILIDEPTSSLDEISELAITQMIKELASQALTLVVAHRLKTLDEAVAILDSSLIESQKELKFYTTRELLQVSKYYQDLMVGKAKLEE